jgi:hypothetical protein
MKRIESIRPAPEGHWVGDGFPVRSLFSIGEFNQRLSPFLLLDYAGPAEFHPASRPRGVGGHPHKGFETVTIVYQGEVEHRDSAGNHGAIGPGDVQWMTAGSGILHEEMHSRAFTEGGGTLEMAQLWVNLPARFKSAPPGYQTILDRDIPSVDLANDAGRVRVIAGEYRGVKGPARTFTPLNVWDVRLTGSAELPVPSGRNAALIVLRGEVAADDGRIIKGGEVAVLDSSGDVLEVDARRESMLLFLDGEPLDEPIAAYGPFVMNTAEEIREAIAQFRAGSIGELS